MEWTTKLYIIYAGGLFMLTALYLVGTAYP